MAMTLKEYQKRVPETVLPHVEKLGWFYPLLGIGGESGEIFEKFKKIVRDKDGVITEEDKQAITKELGDLMWYISYLCTQCGIDLEDVAQGNLVKLADRKERGVLGGSGDNR